MRTGTEDCRHWLPARGRPRRALAVLGLALALALGTAGCESSPRPAGDPCRVPGGQAGLGKDPCDHLCLDKVVTCPNGNRVMPGVCTGEECTATGNCPSGQVCLRLGPQRSYCLPDDECL